MSDGNREIVPVGKQEIVAFVNRQIKITEKLVARILDNDGTLVTATCSELIENLVYTDPQSGLMWTRTGNIAGCAMNWDEAINWVKTLKYAGHNDWRLPSKEEFEAIPSEWFNDSGFNNVKGCYWSGTESGNDSAWYVFMKIGSVHNYIKYNDYYVWPLRSCL